MSNELTYLYETHLHTLPASRCAHVGVRENIEFYKSLGYEGVFITNHFLDGYFKPDDPRSYEEKLDVYFSDYEEGVRIGKEIGLSVFFGIEMTFKGTDFLVYGLDKEWFLAHPESETLEKSKLLPIMIESGALVIQAHPFREARYIDHIRLFPRVVHGVEVYNACRTDFENAMALQYADNYGLLHFAGSDNHRGSALMKFGGMQSPTPILDEKDFVARVLGGEIVPFRFAREEQEKGDA